MNGHRERMVCFVEFTGDADLFQLVIGAAVDFHLELAGPMARRLSLSRLRWARYARVPGGFCAV